MKTVGIAKLSPFSDRAHKIDRLLCFLPFARLLPACKRFQSVDALLAEACPLLFPHFLPAACRNSRNPILFLSAEALHPTHVKSAPICLSTDPPHAMSWAAEDVPAELWAQANSEIWEHGNLDLLAGFVYFESAYMTTGQLVEALNRLQNSGHLWYLPSRWSDAPIPTSIQHCYPPIKGRHG